MDFHILPAPVSSCVPGQLPVTNIVDIHTLPELPFTVQQTLEHRVAKRRHFHPVVTSAERSTAKIKKHHFKE
jgi:hypothetical protein